MVIAQLKAAVYCNLSQLIETIAQLFPFLFCGNRLIIAKHGASLCKQAAGQLADIDARCANGFQKVQGLDKFCFVLFIWLGAQKAGKPLRGNFDAAQIQGVI